jgi:FkbM family methyltransferase
MNLISKVLSLIPFAARGKIKSIPGVAQLQRAVISRTLDGRAFEHRVDAGPAQGITFQISMPEDKGIWTGTYELDFAERLARAVRPGMVAYDIGSWHGFFAGVMAAQGAGEVHVFEPLPENVERIRRLVSLNPGRSIKLHSCAVGEREAEMDLLILPQTSMAKLETSTFQANERASDRVRVKVRSLDAMVGSGEIAPPGLIKIDVEGAEMMVLLGAIQTIRRNRPVLFAEVHSSTLLKQCQELLTTEHYRIEQIDADLDSACMKDVFQIMATP